MDPPRPRNRGTAALFAPAQRNFASRKWSTASHPASFYVSPPFSSGVDAADLRTAVSDANSNGDPSNTIYLTHGDYTLTAGDLAITKNLTIERDPSDVSGLSITLEDDSSGSPGIFSISSGVNLTLGGTLGMYVLGGIHGAGSLTWNGSSGGVLDLYGDANDFSGGLEIADGTVEAEHDADLGTTYGTVTVDASATLQFSDNTETAKTYAIAGVVTMLSGLTVTFDNGPVYGSVYGGGLLEGADSIFATDATDGAAFVNLNFDGGVTVVSNSPADYFKNVNNYATLDVTAGVNSTGANTVNTFGGDYGGFVNESSGTIEIGAGAQVNASNFQSYGTMILDPATVGGSEYTLFTNTGTATLALNGGSSTEIGTAATANSGGFPTFVAGINLDGKDLTVSDGTINNNGFISDFSSGTAGKINVTDYALYKGVGFTGVEIVTSYGGTTEAGDCPGVATSANLTFGDGGVAGDRFQIDDATGTAGPSPNDTGHVDGWSLFSTGNFSWTADTDHKMTVGVQTLSTTTTEGQDVAGTMENFDPTQSYSWAAVTWTGTYTGPTDVAA